AGWSPIPNNSLARGWGGGAEAPPQQFSMSLQDIGDDVIQAAIEEFGRAVTYIPDSGDSLTIKAVVRREYVDVGLGQGVPLAGMQTVIDLRLADLPSAPARGDRVSIDGTEYDVILAQPNGGGAT